MKNIFLLLTISQLFIGCFSKSSNSEESNSEESNSKYFLHMNYPRVPVAIILTKKEVSICEFRNTNGKREKINLKSFPINEIKENELYEFKITDNSVICKELMLTLKFNDINGTWRINNGMLENVDSIYFYWKEVESELFK